MVINSVQQIIAFKSMLRAQYVTVFIMRSVIPFWWCASTALKAVVWFAVIMLSFGTRVLKATLSAWYFWIFTPNVAAYRSSACFALTYLCAVVLSVKCTYVNLEKWSTNMVATLYFLLFSFYLITGLSRPWGDSIW